MICGAKKTQNRLLGNLWGKELKIGPSVIFGAKKTQNRHLSNLYISQLSLHATLSIIIGNESVASTILAFYVFGALTLLVGRHEGHSACKTEWWGAGVVPEKGPLNVCSSSSSSSEIYFKIYEIY